MKDYSQDGEQAAILKAVEGVRSGRFLDLGAWHPTEFSNSRALVENGWTGLLVECSPGPARNLIQEYGANKWPGIEVIVAAVGFEKHLIKIHATDDAVSTSDAATLEKWKSAGGYYGSFLIPQITLEDIGNQFGSDYSFINIDVEGASVDVFHRVIELGWSPKCVCVEYDDRLPELLTCASRAGYVASFTNGTNCVLVRA